MAALGFCTILGCGPKKPPRIEGPPPEYEMPEEYDAGADSEDGAAQ